MKTKKFLLLTVLLLGAVIGGNAQTDWNTAGNVGTPIYFIGTTNNSPIIFKTNNVFSGSLGGSVTSFGYDSMQFDHAGSTAFGSNALHSSVAVGNSGYNSAFGAFALRSNTIGGANTAVGYQSMNTNVIGQQNTALGYQSLFSNLADQNTAIGLRALNLNTNGTGNTAVGINAMRDGVTGSNNTAIGNMALLKATGDGNVGIGTWSGLFTTGNYNSFIGFESGKELTTGINNSFFGISSGRNITTGSYNVVLGTAAFPTTAATATATGYDSTRIIVLADGSNNQRLLIDNNGNAGIGLGNNVKPQNKLEIKHGTTGNSGLRFTNLLNTSASIINTTNKVLSVNATGDVILVDDKQGGTGSGGVTSNVLTSAVNTMTSNVNGLAATAPIVNSVANTITTGQLTTTVNGVASTPVALPNLVEVDGSITNELSNLSLTGNVLTLTNPLTAGNSVTLPTFIDTDAQTLSISGNVLTISNGNSVTLPAATGGVDTSIYANDGTLASNRIVTMGNNNLIFNTTSNNPATGGRVYIGNTSVFTTANFPTTTGDYRLYVEGGILTEKVKVALRSSANWADYVFANNYKLMPLAEVAAFIAKNKHLPGVSSAENLVKEGLDLGEMQSKQMAKIEELTLYAIEQNKRIENQDKEIEELKILVKALVNKNK